MKIRKTSKHSAYHHFHCSRPEQQVDLGPPFHTVNLNPQKNEMEILLLMA